MLTKESALAFYQDIVANGKSGNYEQKVLGLRRIFNRVLLKMFPSISEQDFYRACIDQIFETKKKRGEFRPSFSKNQREYHQLRIYFNRIMHSEVVADEKGYFTAVHGLSSLINFCSKIDIPVDITSIYTSQDIKSTNKKSTIINENPNIETTTTVSTSVLSKPPTLCIIVDRRNDLSNEQLVKIENGIGIITKKALQGNLNFVVFTIKSDSSILAFPISGKKVRFTFNGISEEENIKPLRDYLVNLKPEVQYHFFLTSAFAEYFFRIPVSLNEYSFMMSIGLVGKGIDKKLSYDRKLSHFDKLILDSNLPSFFDWIVKIVNNE